jgi:diacylglycerol kinase family enzyme
MENNSKHKILAIFNGRNFKNKKVDSLLHVFKNHPVDYIFTSKKDHIDEILKDKTQYEGYLVFGGDGTIHETLNQLIGTDKWFSFFPGGTVNCIAGYFKMKRTASFLNSFLNNNHEKSFDLLKVDLYKNAAHFTTYVLGFITIGHLANMTINAEKYRWMPRFIRYPFVGILSFFRIQKFKSDIRTDHSQEENKTLTSIIINNCSAERFSSLQKSKYDDGYFEYLIENNNTFSQIASVYSQFYSLSSKFNWKTTNKQLSLTFNKPLSVMADGEIYEDITKMDIEICPSHQKIKLPLEK